MTRKEQLAKEAYIRRNPHLANLVEELLQSEDAAQLIKRIEAIEIQKTQTKPK